MQPKQRTLLASTKSRLNSKHYEFSEKYNPYDRGGFGRHGRYGL